MRSKAMMRGPLVVRIGVDGTTADVLRALTRLLTLFDRLDEHEQWPTSEKPRPSGPSTADSPDIGRGPRPRREGLATADAWGTAPGTGLFRDMADIHVCRGHLHRVRSTIAEARTRHLLLPHLLAVPGSCRGGRARDVPAAPVRTRPGSVHSC